MNPLCFSCGGLKASGGRDSPEARDLVKSCASPIHLLVNLRQASWRGRIRNAQKLIRSRMSYLREPNMFVRERDTVTVFNAHLSKGAINWKDSQTFVGWRPSLLLVGSRPSLRRPTIDSRPVWAPAISEPGTFPPL